MIGEEKIPNYILDAPENVPMMSRVTGRALGAFEMSEVSALYESNRILDGLDALNESWNNRITGKVLRALGKAYTKGRLSFVAYLKLNMRGEGETHKPSFSAGIQDERVAGDVDLAIHVSNDCVSQFGDSDRGRDEVVFIDVVCLGDFPKKVVPSLVRLYACEKHHDESGEPFHYSTVRWSALSRFGGHEGFTELVPRFIGWETYAFRGQPRRSHHAGHDVIHRGVEVMEGIANNEGDIRFHFIGRRLYESLSGLSVVIDDRSAEISLGVFGQHPFEVTKVAFGPIDL